MKILILKLCILFSIFIGSCINETESPTALPGVVSELQVVDTFLNPLNNLNGVIRKVSWASTHLNETRSITIYEPPNYCCDSKLGLLVVTDEILDTLAPLVESLISDNSIEPIILVGIDHRNVQGVDTIFKGCVVDFRGLEFIGPEELAIMSEDYYRHLHPDSSRGRMNFDEDKNNECWKRLWSNPISKRCLSNRYQRFSSYIEHEVIPYLRNHYPLSESMDQLTLGGFSNGGSFVYAFTSDYPGVFGNAIVMSPAGPFRSYSFDESDSRYFICAGDQEGHFLSESKAYLNDFTRLDISYLHMTYHAGHDLNMWLDFYLESVSRIYGK